MTRLSRAVAAACALLALGACSSSSSKSSAPNTEPTSTSPSGGGGGGSSTTASSTTAGPIPDLCTVVTKEMVAGAFGGNIGAGKKNADSDNGCDFDIGGAAKAGTSAAYSVTVADNGDWSPIGDAKAVAGSDVEELSGLGTDAYYVLGTVHAKVGTSDLTVISIGFGVDKNEVKADSIALAKATIAKLKG